MNICYERESEDSAPRCVLEVSTADIRHNYETLRSISSGKIIAVVKNNGYGLGLIPYSRLLMTCGVTCLAVADAAEGAALREAGIQGDILVMSPPEDEVSARKIAGYGLTAAVGSCGDIYRLEKAAAEQNTFCRVHVKLDTGFGRFGFSPEEAETAAHNLRQCGHLQAEGVFTHCGVFQPRQVQQQYDLFMKTADRLCTVLQRELCRHFCHSSLALRYPHFQLDAIRVGSALLGRTAGAEAAGLKPVGRLKGRVQDIRVMPAGSRPGYAGAQRLAQSTRVAVVAAGWQDGFGLERRRETARPRELLSQIGQLLARAGKGRYVYHDDESVPVLGHGGMNFTLLNASQSHLAVGDWVTMPVNPLLVPMQVRREYIDM